MDLSKLSDEDLMALAENNLLVLCEI
jgi:hypothetical protein